VEILAAGLYASSFIIWTLGNNHGLSEPELKPTVYIHQAPGLSGWEASSLALLLVAIALTFAAIRLRRSSGNS